MCVYMLPPYLSRLLFYIFSLRLVRDSSAPCFACSSFFFLTDLYSPAFSLVRSPLSCQLAAGRPARAEEQLRELLLSSAEGDEAASFPTCESVKVRICLATFRLDQNDTSAATRLLREAQGLVLQNVLSSEGSSSQTPSSSSSPQDTERDDSCTASQNLLREIVTLQQLTGDEEGALECLDAQFNFWKDQQRKKVTMSVCPSVEASLSLSVSVLFLS